MKLLSLIHGVANRPSAVPLVMGVLRRPANTASFTQQTSIAGRTLEVVDQRPSRTAILAETGAGSCHTCRAAGRRRFDAA